MSPLRKSDSDEATKENFEEVHKSGTFKRTRKKYGRKAANRQATAIVLKEKRKATQRKRGSKR